MNKSAEQQAEERYPYKTVIENYEEDTFKPNEIIMLERIAFREGHHSRDSEVKKLQERITELEKWKATWISILSKPKENDGTANI